MEVAAIVIAIGAATVMIILALRFDHTEDMEKIRRRHGPTDKAS